MQLHNSSVFAFSLYLHATVSGICCFMHRLCLELYAFEFHLHMPTHLYTDAFIFLVRPGTTEQIRTRDGSAVNI